MVVHGTGQATLRIESDVTNKKEDAVHVIARVIVIKVHRRDL